MPGPTVRPATRAKLKPPAVISKVKIGKFKKTPIGPKSSAKDWSQFVKPSHSKPKQRSLIRHPGIRGTLNPKFLPRYQKLAEQIETLKHLITGGVKLDLFKKSLQSLQGQDAVRNSPGRLQEVARLGKRLNKLEIQYQRTRNSKDQKKALLDFFKEVERFQRDLGSFWNGLRKP